MREKREFNPTLKIDPEFESKIPPLTEEEYKQLEANIVTEGVILMPLIVWNNTIIDGHNRYKIAQAHPRILFDAIEKEFDNRYEALSWICKNQLGRRNLTPTQKRLLIGDQYEAERMAHGASDGFRGNQNNVAVCGQSGHIPESGKTRKRIAEETNTSESFVKRASQYSKGATAGEEVSPGFRQDILTGKIKPTQKEMKAIARASPQKRKSLMEQIFCPKRAKADKETLTAIQEISDDMAREKPSMTAQEAVQHFGWQVTRMLQSFDSTFDEWPQLISDKTYRQQVVATLHDLKQYILQIEGGTRYEWEHDTRKIV
jgi:hypothetical protein